MSGELILIIEDEANIIQLDRLYLEREGFKVESAADGQAGLQAIDEGKTLPNKRQSPWNME